MAYAHHITGKGKITGTADADRIEGAWGSADVLVGGAGSDLLDGGGNYDLINVDKLIGGLGDDRYVVGKHDSFVFDYWPNLTTIVERADEGIDIVEAWQTYKLPSYVENLILKGSENLIGTGNALANTITGNKGNNTLNGGKGADTLIGGGGIDTFIVDNSGDTVKGKGNVEASASFVLSAGLSNLLLTGSSAINGTGNSGANIITGNAKSNVLSGMGGNDHLIGGSGNDTLLGGTGNDRLEGGAGRNTLDGGTGDDVYVVDFAGNTLGEASGGGRDAVIARANVVLGNGIEGVIAVSDAITSLIGSADDNVMLVKYGALDMMLDGRGGDDMLLSFDLGNRTLIGGAGDDVLVSFYGQNRLTGGSGRDTFLIRYDYDRTQDAEISDFVSGSDRVVVANSFLSGLLLSGGFVQGTAARDADDLAIYDKASGRLWADTDGNGPGSQVLVATLKPGTTLAYSDIQLIDDISFASQTASVQDWLNGLLVAM